MTAVVRIADLRKQYGDFVAVNAVNLELQAGDVFALIGPNGAGKTTLLRMLAGLVRPTYGQAWINNVPIDAHDRSYYHQLGFMPDVYALYDELTVYEYLDYFAASYQVPDREKRIQHVIAQVQLEIKTQTLTKGLSKGMRQRLLLAKTLLHDPAVLLLDEPAAGLDPKARIELRDIIRSLQQQGKTLIISSHILSELEDFCNTYGIMEQGHFVKTGRFGEIAAQDWRSVLLEVLPEGRQKLMDTLATYPSCRIVQTDPIMIEIKGNQQQMAELFIHLGQAEVPIVGFHEKRENIEDLFMKYSHHQVS